MTAPCWYLSGMYSFFSSLFLDFLCFHALSDRERHALACPLRFGYLYQRNVFRLVGRLINLLLQTRRSLRCGVGLNVVAYVLPFGRKKRRMVYNLLFHVPLRCYFDIKLFLQLSPIMLTALIGFLTL